jgi:agmatinase
MTRIALIGIRSDENSSYLRGAASAPPAIREALWCPSSNSWSESGIEVSRDRIHDAGDVADERGTDNHARIEATIASLLDSGYSPISLGGDHSITYPILRAFAPRHPRLSILHFDAHPDISDEFEGNRLSHACPFARIMEERLAGRLVQVGIRCANAHQRAQAARFGVEMIEMKDSRRAAPPRFDTPVYVSFDLDALDPAFAPGVAHREPGGLSTREALDMIAAVNAPIVGADVVELNPRQDVSGMTATVAAKLVKEIAGRMLAARD